ncbi:MAG: endonuclease/exonuclease/phosphatase family protein [Bifidobacteriaceae bacterium]|jgi:endonuclease/exonuclease/phosphatase family metal-dependent hydrolase|nr:endonuclease/exonuclease/phosphatase family protein [Bifidobacteriaceae bacterium]
MAKAPSDKPKKRFRPLRIVVKTICGLVVLVVVAVGLFLGWATAVEYAPRSVEHLSVTGEAVAGAQLAAGGTVEVLTWNIGYAGLGAEQDFFMDGGTMVQPESQADVERYMAGILATLEANPAQIYLLQEVDTDSKRSFGLNEQEQIAEAITGLTAFAYNFKSAYTPYPWPPIGKVNSGIMTISSFAVSQPQRIALPVPFKWPVKLFNLKRCLLVERIPVDDGGYLVVINVHLEAYSDPEGRAAQMKQLVELAHQEYEDGNYVIIGGDFNQTLPGFDFPTISTNWEPGVFDAEALGEGWTVADDPNVPTSRLNDKPYSGSWDDTQLLGIDGFILSPNVEAIYTRGIDQEFAYSDHNPVILKARLLKD